MATTSAARNRTYTVKVRELDADHKPTGQSSFPVQAISRVQAEAATRAELARRGLQLASSIAGAPGDVLLVNVRATPRPVARAARVARPAARR